MKTNLIISNCAELRMDGTDYYQFLDEYCRDHALSNGLAEMQCLMTVSKKRTTQDSINFIKTGLERYLPVVAERLANIHHQPIEFWRRAVFIYLRDLIGSTQTMFEQLESVFDPNKHQLHIASLPNRVPLFSIGAPQEDSLYWGVSDEGREYYAAEYFRCFYPGQFSEIALKLTIQPPVLSNKCRKVFGGGVKKLIKYLLTANNCQLRVLVYNIKFDRLLALKLLLSSYGKVSFFHKIPNPFENDSGHYAMDPIMRMYIAQPLIESQLKYEQYLGKCLQTSLPWCLAEGFSSSFEFYRNYWNSFPRLKYVVAEAMYQEDALPIAVAKLQGIEPLKIHHFFPLEIFSTEKINQLSVKDRFLCRGEKQLSDLAIGMGTVYPYRMGEKARQTVYEILYITTDFYSYFQPLQQSADGNGYDVYKIYKKFVGDFLKELSVEISQRISLKKRIPSHPCALQLDYPSIMRKLDPSVPAIKYMSGANLIIVEGLSTSLFEALASDVPVIAFWPAELYHFQKQYEDYFASLEEVGIVFHDPQKLAQQVRLLYNNPNVWWLRSETRKARAEFIEKNSLYNAPVNDTLLEIANQ